MPWHSKLSLWTFVWCCDKLRRCCVFGLCPLFFHCVMTIFQSMWLCLRGSYFLQSGLRNRVWLLGGTGFSQHRQMVPPCVWVCTGFTKHALWSQDVFCGHKTCFVITRHVLWSQDMSSDHNTCLVITRHVLWLSSTAHIPGPRRWVGRSGVQAPQGSKGAWAWAMAMLAKQNHRVPFGISAMLTCGIKSHASYSCTQSCTLQGGPTTQYKPDGSLQMHHNYYVRLSGNTKSTANFSSQSYL